MEKFWSRVNKSDNCWVWTGAKLCTHGNIYGQFRLPGTPGRRIRVMAHRFSYELAHGKIPDGLVIDHLCRNGLCVNPDHLEAVTNVENILRGTGSPAQNYRKSVCKRGHELTPGNVWNRRDGRRACKACDASRRRVAR